MKFWKFSSTALAGLLAAVSVVNASGPTDGNAVADPDSAVVKLTSSDFKEFIDTNPLVLAEFFAPWCGYCKILGPEFTKAANDLNETHPNIKLAQIDCEVEHKLCSEYGIRGFPTLKVVKGSDVEPVDYQGPRSAEGITDYMIKQSLPAVSVPEGVEALEEVLLSQTSPFIVQVLPSNYNDAKDKLKHNETFFNVGDELRNDLSFISVQSGSLVEALKSKFKNIDLSDIKEPVYIVAHPEQFEDASEFSEAFDAESLKSFIKKEVIPYFGEIDGETYAMYMQSSTPLAYYFYTTDEQKSEAGKLLSKLGKEFRGKLNFVGLNANLYGRQAEVLSMDPEVFPLFAIQDIQNNLKYGISQKEFPEGPTLESVEKFVKDFIKGELSPIIKSEELPTEEEDASSPVKKLVAHNHDEVIGDISKDVFVKYYANWCGHCKKMAPTWEELAGLYSSGDSKVIIAKIDHTLNDVNTPVQIEGYPTLLLYPANGEIDEKTGLRKPIVFHERARELEDFITFVRDNGFHKVDASYFKSEENETPEEAAEDVEEAPKKAKENEHDEL